MLSALHGSEGSEHKLQDYDMVRSSIRGQNFEGMYLYDKVRRKIIIPSSTLNMWHCFHSVHRYPSTRIYCVKIEAHCTEYYSVSNGYSHAASLSSDMTERQHTTVLSTKALLCTLLFFRGSIGGIWSKRFLYQSIIDALWQAAISMSVPA